MKKFQYKFQKILEYKGKIEKIQIREFSKVKKEYEEEKEKLNEFIEYKNRISKDRDKLIEHTTIEDLKLFSSYINIINRRINRQKSVVNNKQKEFNKAQIKLVNATQERKIMEKIKDRDYDEYLYLVKKEEERHNDQIVSFNNSIK